MRRKGNNSSKREKEFVGDLRQNLFSYDFTFCFPVTHSAFSIRPLILDFSVLLENPYN
jgi:hypothetical protein